MRLIRRSERGQILPLFALMLVALMGITALAFDVSNAYAARRAFRTAADAASLAGALDLQVVGTRQVGSAQYTAARSHAEEALEKELNDTVTCGTPDPLTNKSACTFANFPYQASITTPLLAGACVSCDIARSVQVNVGNPSFTLTFARALGLGQFNVAVGAVAGLQFAHAYTIFALRPPSAPAISGVRSLAINGGTQVIVVNGDVGTNANMTYSGTNSLLVLDSGFRMDYYDPFNGPLWGTNPTASKIVNLVPDPAYPIPSRTGAPVSGPDTVANCTPIAATIYANANYAPSVPVTGTPAAPDMSNITCYKPGVYGSAVGVNNGQLAILEPGLYFFDRGLDVQGSVIGGYTPASPGVALVFPESSGTEFKNRTGGGGSSLTQTVALNAGTRYLNSGGQEATAALDYSNNPVQTNTTPAKLMTVMVPPDPRCPVAFPFPASCSNAAENQNKSIDLSGGTGLYLAGVQYMPTDNVTVAGNAVTGGYIGQVWAWTLVYTGGSNINQEGSQSQGPGTIRLDAACTLPGVVCVP
jgi:Flp pilus assembly protein TadG